jgi:hypothetical protein
MEIIDVEEHLLRIGWCPEAGEAVETAESIDGEFMDAA